MVSELKEGITTEIGEIELDPLDILMFALGDSDTKTALIAYFRGEPHPILSMDEESRKELDSALAKEIVGQSTVDPDAKVHSSQQSKRVAPVSSKDVTRNR